MRFRVARLSAILMVVLLLDVRSGRAEIAPLSEPPPFPPTLGIDPMTEPQLRASLSVLQTFYQTFLTVRTSYPAIVASTRLDWRGRTLADDFKDYCLPAAEQEGFTHQFADISTALDKQDLGTSSALLSTLRYRLRVASIQCKTIVDYWRDIASHPQDWQPYRDMLLANGVTPHYAANIESLERTFQLKIRHGLFIYAIGGTLPLLERVRLRAEMLDIEALEALAASPTFQGLYPLNANEPCDLPAARSSGKSTPSIDSSRPRPNLVFPEESRRTRESGMVFVGVMVATTGCARQASIVGSSGYARLDQAGVRYAMTMRFLPAEKDGGAIERFVVLPINFKLTARN
jgi:TonB family protein